MSNVHRDHHLKIHPSQYRDAERGGKYCEFRKNDRDYQVGDTLVLHWFDPSPPTKPDPMEGYCLQPEEVTKRYNAACREQDEQDVRHAPQRRRVTHILHGGRFGVPVGYCLMSVEWVK